jgi:RHS repeat-associated protein
MVSSRQNLLANGFPKDGFYQYDALGRLTCDASEGQAPGTCAASALKLRVETFTEGGDSRSTIRFFNDDVDAAAVRSNYFYEQTPTTSNTLVAIHKDPPGLPWIMTPHGEAGRRERDEDVMERDPVPPNDIKPNDRNYMYLPSGRLGLVQLWSPKEGEAGVYESRAVTAAYDHRGRRFFKSWADFPDSNAVAQWYTFYGPDGRVLEEKYFPDSTDSTNYTIYSYVHIPGGPAIRFKDVYDPGPPACEPCQTRSYYQNDHLGTPLAMMSWPVTGVDAGVTWQADYDAFGWAHPDRDLVPPFGLDPVSYQPFRFPGQMEDAETAAVVWDDTESMHILLRPGLVQNWHRTYDPYMGRYLESDPLLHGTKGAPSATALVGADNPLQPYVYANNAPLSFLDPTGLASCFLYIGGGNACMACISDVDKSAQLEWTEEVFSGGGRWNEDGCKNNTSKKCECKIGGVDETTDREFGGPVPEAVYDIVKHPRGRTDAWRLKRQKGEPPCPKERTRLNIVRGGGRSHGCLVIGDRDFWKRTDQWFKDEPTSTLHIYYGTGRCPGR